MKRLAEYFVWTSYICTCISRAIPNSTIKIWPTYINSINTGGTGGFCRLSPPPPLIYIVISFRRYWVYLKEEKNGRQWTFRELFFGDVGVAVNTQEKDPGHALTRPHTHMGRYRRVHHCHVTSFIPGIFKLFNSPEEDSGKNITLSSQCIWHFVVVVEKGG